MDTYDIVNSYKYMCNIVQIRQYFIEEKQRNNFKFKFKINRFL